MDIYPKIRNFLAEDLKLETHNISIRTISSGVDLLGWVNFPFHRVLRTRTKRKMFHNLNYKNSASLASYLGLLKHGHTRKITLQIRNSLLT